VTLEAALPAARIAPARAALTRWIASLGEFEVRACEIRVATEPSADVDWAQVWRQHHRSAGGRPPPRGRAALGRPASADREVLVVEPGMAFGTGRHATTRACLDANRRARQCGRIGSVLDVGTGSGILAIAAARLGVGRLVALDVDPAVLPIARANIERNGADAVLLVGGPIGAVAARFDLVVANLLADALVTDAPALAHAVAPGGHLVVSGLTADQLRRVSAAWRGWTITETRAEDEWRTLTLERADETT